MAGRGFSAAAAQLAGHAQAMLGWRPDEFWAATPADLALAVAGLVPTAEVPADGALLTRLKELFPDG
ncbi:phage tail assembly chaperone [Sphingomonas changnyeongensis]|uniref:Phage tail assembly chaperone n=1 Tax=Sphingomonas changnyeongensis TaxID=2698679 RepID=A0A7Z2NW92_9SPHN|nr:phage tail assembly chaperone [Sphingomonas changnyeongensis]QHL90662.1 phage tail assembly chaperone [Sphingomonas changnyeongensis]